MLVAEIVADAVQPRDAGELVAAELKPLDWTIPAGILKRDPCPEQTMASGATMRHLAARKCRSEP
jgi:hypothetical protein